MGDIDISEFDEANRKPLQRLKVAVILDELDDDRREALLMVLRDRSYSASAIARVVTGWGHEVSQDAVIKWRNKNI